MPNNKFNFFVPTELTKGKNDSGQDVVWIDGIASSESEDADGETLTPSGFNLKPLLDSGMVNFNHQGSKDANANVGIPTQAKIINNGKDLYIKCMLWPCPQTDGIVRMYENFKKYPSGNRKVGFSIEGMATQRGSNDKNSPLYNKVLKADISGVAVTFFPKNKNTMMNILKGNYSEPFIGTINKSDDNFLGFINRMKEINYLETNIKNRLQKGNTDSDQNQQDVNRINKNLMQAENDFIQLAIGYEKGAISNEDHFKLMNVFNSLIIGNYIKKGEPLHDLILQEYRKIGHNAYA